MVGPAEFPRAWNCLSPARATRRTARVRIGASRCTRHMWPARRGRKVHRESIGNGAHHGVHRVRVRPRTFHLPRGDPGCPLPRSARLISPRSRHHGNYRSRRSLLPPPSPPPPLLLSTATGLFSLRNFAFRFWRCIAEPNCTRRPYGDAAGFLRTRKFVPRAVSPKWKTVKVSANYSERLVLFGKLQGALNYPINYVL